MQAQALPGVDLADLAAKDGQGTDISAALEAAGLTRGGFLYLRELGRLAATGDLTAVWLKRPVSAISRLSPIP